MNRPIPIRLIISGFAAPVSATLDRLVNMNDFTVVRVPSIGDVLSASMNPRLWHSAMDAFMACHPGSIVFVGGLRADHDWLIERGALVMHISEKCVIEVASGFCSRSAHWIERTPLATRSLDQKISAALVYANFMVRHRKAA